MPSIIFSVINNDCTLAFRTEPARENLDGGETADGEVVTLCEAPAEAGVDPEADAGVDPDADAGIDADTGAETDTEAGAETGADCRDPADAWLTRFPSAIPGFAPERSIEELWALFFSIARRSNVPSSSGALEAGRAVFRFEADSLR